MKRNGSKSQSKKDCCEAPQTAPAESLSSVGGEPGQQSSSCKPGSPQLEVAAMEGLVDLVQDQSDGQPSDPQRRERQADPVSS